MTRILQPLRFLSIFGFILIFLITTTLVWPLVRNRWRRIRVWTEIVHQFTSLGLWILNVKVNVIGDQAQFGKRHGLWVGNHLSYLDVLILGSKLPTCFVTSMEIKETPLLGQICQMTGCLFVERRNRTNLLKEIAELTEALQHDLDVTIFPEATSTNGEQVLRFRRPLFVSAVQARKPLFPFCLNYRTFGSEPVSLKNRDSIFWYGDMPFASHLWRLCGAGEVGVDLVLLPEILTPAAAEAANLAEEAQRSVESVFQPVIS